MTKASELLERGNKLSRFIFIAAGERAASDMADYIAQVKAKVIDLEAQLAEVLTFAGHDSNCEHREGGLCDCGFAALERRIDVLLNQHKEPKS